MRPQRRQDQGQRDEAEREQDGDDDERGPGHDLHHEATGGQQADRAEQERPGRHEAPGRNGATTGGREQGDDDQPGHQEPDRLPTL